MISSLLFHCHHFIILQSLLFHCCRSLTITIVSLSLLFYYSFIILSSLSFHCHQCGFIIVSSCLLLLFCWCWGLSCCCCSCCPSLGDGCCCWVWDFNVAFVALLQVLRLTGVGFELLTLLLLPFFRWLLLIGAGGCGLGLTSCYCGGGWLVLGLSCCCYFCCCCVVVGVG